jgi:hypothetical protein
MKETLEEAGEIWVDNRFTKQICGDESYPDIYASKESITESHILFAKWLAEWQADKMYSEEDLKQAFKAGGKMSWTDIDQETQEPYYYDFNEWFEQFKK